MKFGTNGSLSVINYTASDDWSQNMPIYFSMREKEQVYELLNLALTSCQFQGVRSTGSYVDPAPDCQASHYANGYEPIGGITRLFDGLISGWITKDFQTTPAVMDVGFSIPSKNG
jgi:hypothetical protein